MIFCVMKKRFAAPQCECGCDGTTKGGRFLPGHDAKLKKHLIGLALSGKKRAANRLEQLGWIKHLAIAKQKRITAERKA